MSAERSHLSPGSALELAESLLDALAEDARLENGRLVIRLDAGSIPEAARRLRDDDRLSFKYLSFVTGVDYRTRLDAVYVICSLKHPVIAELKAALDPGRPAVPTVSDVWSTAVWHEREAYDLLGIEFEGHPDLRRILTREDFGVFPLRKESQPRREERRERQWQDIGPPVRLPGEAGRSGRS